MAMGGMEPMAAGAGEEPMWGLADIAAAAAEELSQKLRNGPAEDEEMRWPTQR
jgi:hypothetical protein